MDKKEEYCEQYLHWKFRRVYPSRVIESPIKTYHSIANCSLKFKLSVKQNCTDTIGRHNNSLKQKVRLIGLSLEFLYIGSN